MSFCLYKHPSVLHSFPGHNYFFVVRLKYCLAQNSGDYLQGLGHRATLKQICYQAMTLLFMVGFRY